MKVPYTQGQRFLEALSALLLAGMFVFLTVYWPRIPQEVPMHFNAAGEIDRWGGRGSVLVVPICAALLYALITAVGFVPALWNTGIKPLKPENSMRVYTLTRSLFLTTKAIMVAIFAYITVYITLARPMPGAFLPVSLTLLFGSMLYYVVRILRANR